MVGTLAQHSCDFQFSSSRCCESVAVPCVLCASSGAKVSIPILVILSTITMEPEQLEFEEEPYSVPADKLVSYGVFDFHSCSEERLPSPPTFIQKSLFLARLVLRLR